MILTLSFAITLSMKFDSISFAALYAIGNAVGKAFAMLLAMPLTMHWIFH